MLGPLVYVLILLTVILAGGYALNYLARGDGHLVLNYADRVYEVTLFEAAILLVLLIAAVLLVLWVLRILLALLRFIAGDETAFSRFFARSRERRGLDALAGAQLALAEGDGRTARRKARKAEQKLMRPELTRLVNAQAAELNGDENGARVYYRALLADPRTAFAGTRGLLRLALKNHDHDRALKLAEHGRTLRPKDPEILDALYLLQSQSYDWTAARATLAAQAKAGHLPAPEARRREAALALALSEDAAGTGDQENARALAVEAARLDPANTAAVTTATRRLLEGDARRAATKLVTEAWRVQPRPQLAAAFAALEPDEAPAARRRRFEQLFAIHPEHPETQFLRAELALADRDWSAAQAAIGDLRETEPSARSCAIMAAIARGRGEPDHVVRAWLARALGAPRDGSSEMFISHSAMLPLLVESDEPRPTPAASVAAAVEPAATPDIAGVGPVPSGPAEADDAEEVGPPPRDLEGVEDVSDLGRSKPAA